MNKKVLAIVIVVAFAAASVGGYALFDSLYGDHHHGKKISLANGYFDITDAESLSICTVQDSSGGDVAAQSVSVNCGQGGNTSAAMLPTGGNVSSACDTYAGYHNELHKVNDRKLDVKVKFYKDKIELKSNHDTDYSDWNIVYLEKCGNIYVMVYTTQNLGGLYDVLKQENVDFWNNDSNMSFVMVDARTGKVFEITGLWCGSTAWRYQGTNDMIPSLQYLGSYGGEEYFKVNVECNKYCVRPAGGEFRNIEGVVAFKINGENFHYRKVLVDEDAMVKEFTGSKNDEASWTQIEGKYKMFGYDMKLYENGLIRYIQNDGTQAGYWQGTFTGEDYVVTADGNTKVKLDSGWKECSNYLCKSVTYYNDYFPTNMEVYDSDGSIKVISDISAERSYELASTSHYRGCIYRETTDNSTLFYILNTNGTVDRLELTKTLEQNTVPNIFGESIPMLNPGNYMPGTRDDFHIYNNEIFYEAENWSYSKYSRNTAVMIVDHCLYAIDGTIMKEYNMKTVEIQEYDIPADVISKMRVDGEGRIYIEGNKSDNICKLDLGDGGFQVSRTPAQLMTLKKVLANDGQDV